jgi:hypothetical protein
VSGSRTPWARFDDLQAGTALRCPSPLRVLAAATPADVVPVLAVDRVTAVRNSALAKVAILRGAPAGRTVGTSA